MITTNRMAMRAQKGRPQALVCQICQRTGSPSPVPRSLFVRTYSSPSIRNVHREQFQPRQYSWTYTNRIPRRFYSSQAEQPTTPQLDNAIAQVARACSHLCKAEGVPSNDAVVQLLQKSESIAEMIAQPTTAQPKQKSGEFSSLFDLDEQTSATKKQRQQQPQRPKQTPEQLSKQLCRAVHDLLTDEKVFISPEALASYTKIHVLLQQPNHFPEIFHLYANKPIPVENSSPVRFSKPDPKSINSAIPLELANAALDVAIAQRNLSLVLAIIDTTFSAPAFRRAKAYKKAALPLGGLTAAPAACYILATWAGSLQNTMDPSTATGIAFAAGLAYVGGLTSVGLVAITTANDQMERVTWLPGIPLRQRWLREEERAAFDKVALAWGFKDIYLRGEEEGEEWEQLREFIGMRGMILDRTELMEALRFHTDIMLKQKYESTK
ncbi:uncharacterized protein BO97DRAFT_479244 [Aspergillus homomorphus CBS 101889]|uniref:Uncharacterized protein n=1 Tax=Aspergillus homomorphus (strain CBS 101889) TaxID=1450537 RepID=A0A395HSV3_ASPHC|nr:hypothetical protein BO97DRAFT_479244 [Aspergillus homomorphus CBS 101889]RAL10425.1 hypothetical protein BO97DRAFT_479244 [Aspergillus homomorphus CBS 101889]